MKNQTTKEVIEAKIAKLSEDRNILVSRINKARKLVVDIETDIAYLEQLTTKTKEA
jgi:flagellar biosynthesis chaperone FliJ